MKRNPSCFVFACSKGGNGGKCYDSVRRGLKIRNPHYTLFYAIFKCENDFSTTLTGFSTSNIVKKICPKIKHAILF